MQKQQNKQTIFK